MTDREPAVVELINRWRAEPDAVVAYTDMTHAIRMAADSPAAVHPEDWPGPLWALSEEPAE